jgi:hypothetical protein
MTNLSQYNYISSIIEITQTTTIFYNRSHKELLRTKALVFLLLLSLGQSSELVTAEPELDGIISKGEWSGGIVTDLEMGNGQVLELTSLYTNTHVYYLAILPHNQPGDEIILNVSIPHDYFGIEFDNNEDDVIMGHPDSPDDLFMVDYIVEGAVDMYSHSFKVFDDEINEGENNVTGSSGSSNGRLIWEVKKPLQTRDKNGFDIVLKTGDKYQIMPAFFDDQPPHSAAGFVPKQQGNTLFHELTVGNPKFIVKEIVGGLSLLGTIGLAFVVVRYGTRK